MDRSEKRAQGAKRSGWLTGRIPAMGRRPAANAGANLQGLGDQAWPGAIGAAPGASPRLPSPSSALGEAWPDAPADFGAAGAAPHMDTGRGYSIVMPTVGANPAPSFLGPQVMPSPRRGAAFVAAAGNLSRFTFNAILIVIILAIIAIPTGIGLMRLHLLPPQAPTAAGPTAKTAVIPTPYPGYQTLRGQAYTIAYPVHWARVTSRLKLDFPGYSGTITLNTLGSKSTTAVSVASTPGMPSNLLQGMLDGVANAYASGYANFQKLAPPAAPRVAATTWQVEAFTFDVVQASRSVTIESEVLLVNHGLYTYIMVLQAPQSQFATTYSQYFARVLGSFHFAAA